MDLLTWPDRPENPKIFKRFYSDSAYEWYYGVNPVIRLKANPLVESYHPKENQNGVAHSTLACREKFM